MQIPIRSWKEENPDRSMERIIVDETNKHLRSLGIVNEFKTITENESKV